MNFNVSSGKSENLYFDVLVLSVTYKFSAKNVQRRIIYRDTEEWCKPGRKTDFLFEKWHEEFDVF